MPAVLLSTVRCPAAEAIGDGLAAAGFAVTEHALGSTPAVDLASFAAAIVLVGNQPAAAAAQTRRWRIELGDQLLPVLWIASPESTILGFEAGADACLDETVGIAVLAAQVKSMGRTRSLANRLADRAGESRLLGEQLHKAYAQLERDGELARRLQRQALPKVLPELGPIRFAVHHQPHAKQGGDSFDVCRIDEHHLGFFVCDVMSGPARSLLAAFIRQSLRFKEIAGADYRLISPEEVLAEVNRTLFELRLEESPLAAILAGTIDVRDGSLALARAGLPPPVLIPAAGEPHRLAIPGPFLGAAAASYPVHRDALSPGDKLLIASDGAGPPEDVLAATIRHQALAGQAFVDAVARELPAEANEDRTLLMISFG